MTKGLLLIVAAAALVWAAVAAGAAGDPRKAFTAADQAYARSMLLRRADLPGRPASWHARKTDFGQPNPPCFVQHHSLAALTETGEAGFEYGVAGGAGVESDAHVFSTAPQAARAFAVVSTPGLARCFGATLAAQARKSLRAATVRLGAIRPIALRSSVAARAYRVPILLRSARGKATLDLVVVNAQRGRALAALSFVGPGGLWTDALVRGLTARAAARLR
jgi:hypothetical protein